MSRLCQELLCTHTTDKEKKKKKFREIIRDSSKEMDKESWEVLALLCTKNGRLKTVKIPTGYSARDNYSLFSMSMQNKSRRNQLNSQQEGFL